MTNSVTVFYGVNDSDLLCEPPIPVFSDALKNDLYIQRINDTGHVFRCPAMFDYYKNTFAVSCPVDYKLKMANAEIFSENYDQDFFNKAVFARNPKEKFFSFKLPNMFLFADADSLNMELLSPTLSKTLIPNALYMQGVYDIANHFRALELAIGIRNDLDVELNFKKDDHLYYIKFLTDKKINFKRFLFTPEILTITPYFHSYRDRTKTVIPLHNYYTKFKKFGIKKRLLTAIKDAVLD